jgi:type I restriction enzyme S subunit
MTLETFFEKFEQFADAPDAVVKMRELVLELAVRGRLLSSYSPDSSDKSDPASPFAIPQDWQWIALNKAADCRAAAKVDATSLNDSDWVLDLEDIDGGAGKVIATATFAERRSLSTKASFQKGDVLYGKLRPYLNKVVIADRPGFCTTEIIPLRPQKFAAAGYLRLFLRSPHFLRYASAKNYGMKMPRLGTQDLESVAIPLPPLAEQQRIVAKVDELMALCDRLEAQQQERETRHAVLARASLARFADAPTPANLNFIFHKSYVIPPADLRKSILTLAVQGKLVPQDPNDEPADQGELFAKEEPKGQARGRTGAELGEITEADVDAEIPPPWVWTRMFRLCAPDASIVYGILQPGPDVRPRGVPYVRPTEIKGGKILLDDVRHTVDEIAAQYTRSRVKTGDILLTIVGTLGATAVIPPELDGGNITQSSCRIRANKKLVDPEFLVRCLQSPLLKRQYEGFSLGSAVRRLNIAHVRALMIPLPPLTEQRRIVVKVEQLMALVDALETQLAASRDKGQKLLEAIVSELTLTS